MKKQRLPEFVRRLLHLSAGHRYYPLVLGLIAFVSTATFAFPFVIVLVPAVLIAPRRWLIIGLLSGLFSGFGGAVLVEIFQFLGQEVVLQRYPHLAETQHWLVITEWMNRYGLFALAIIAGSPVPQTPAVLLYSLSSPSTLGAFIAVGLGKTVKYVFLAYLVGHYPARFSAYFRK